MAVPQGRTSKRKRQFRRSHHALKPPTLIHCGNCGSQILPHRVCSQCGHFKGKPVLDVGNF
jgi:large subunit ribosomal protein L32